MVTLDVGTVGLPRANCLNWFFVSHAPPDHWTSLAGPANWFFLWHPPHWTTGERSGTQSIHPPDSSAFISINTIWLKDGAVPPPSLVEVTKQFPKSRKVRGLTEPSREDVQESLEGEALLNPKTPWLVKVLGGGDWRAWTMWSFQRGPLVVVMTLMHESVTRDRDLEAMVRLILTHMELPERPADPPEMFADRVLSLAKLKFPLLKVKLADEFHLQIGESSLNLFNFYRAYVREPESFEKIMLPALTTVVQVQEWGERQTDPPLEAVQDRLMPMLYPEDVWKERFPEFVGEPWVGGLVILYVVDEANAYWYVRNELLERWGLSGSQLHEIALENLHDYFERKPMEMAVAGAEEEGPSMLMPGRPDSYNSARLLSDLFLRKLREFVGGDLAVGLPGRDFFVAVIARAPEMVEHVRRRVKEDYRHTDHPLTDRMLLITADGVSELVEGEV